MDIISERAKRLANENFEKNKHLLPALTTNKGDSMEDNQTQYSTLGRLDGEVNKYYAEKEAKNQFMAYQQSFESKLNQKIDRLKKELANLEALQSFLKQSPQFVEAFQGLVGMGIF